MVDGPTLIFGAVAILAVLLGITLYRVLPCWISGETIEPTTDHEHSHES